MKGHQYLHQIMATSVAMSPPWPSNIPAVIADSWRKLGKLAAPPIGGMAMDQPGGRKTGDRELLGLAHFQLHRLGLDGEGELLV